MRDSLKKVERKMSLSPKETKDFGRRLSSGLGKGDLVALIGPLGSGKTCLTQGICEGLGVKEIVTSPSFVIINQYPGRLWVYHFDLYRLKDKKELLDLGYEEFFYGEGVCIIEWADKIRGHLPERRIEIVLKIVSDRKRAIEVRR